MLYKVTFFFILKSERGGFEPPVELPPHNLSKVAPSTTRTPLLIEKRHILYQNKKSKSICLPKKKTV